MTLYLPFSSTTEKTTLSLRFMTLDLWFQASISWYKRAQTMSNLHSSSVVRASLALLWPGHTFRSARERLASAGASQSLLGMSRVSVTFQRGRGCCEGGHSHIWPGLQYEEKGCSYCPEPMIITDKIPCRPSEVLAQVCGHIHQLQGSMWWALWTLTRTRVISYILTFVIPLFFPPHVLVSSFIECIFVCHAKFCFSIRQVINKWQ